MFMLACKLGQLYIILEKFRPGASPLVHVCLVWNQTSWPSWEDVLKVQWSLWTFHWRSVWLMGLLCGSSLSRELVSWQFV